MANYRHAGFWVRLGSYVIDSLLVFMPFWLAGVLVFDTTEIQQVPALYIPYVFISTLYFIAMPLTSYQATLGKVVFGLKITNGHYTKLSIGQAIGRYFAQMLSYVLLFAGFIMIGLTKNKTGLHDKLAKTYVVYKD
ncbi:RDD family protein [Salipaludibacillus agaradhaerens]|jgi:uncharacterized RDD family membrane protein YckC|uniref:RDD family protein n=1 Tax=Salipaludibacillus agaradhaerens TaxID=76935 RepID=UPI000996BECA|nr:RDD family protein [Salipaludibacillus agaradhaerens]